MGTMESISAVIDYWRTHDIPDPDDYAEIGTDDDGRPIYARRQA